MRFLDENIRLILKDSIGSKEYQFKAYMKDSDVSYEIQETNLAMAPIGFTNTKIHSRTLQTLKVSFGVFSEYREEAIENYDNLHSLIESLKPSYNNINDQYLPDDKNTFGFLSVNFKGLPKISGVDDLKLHITQFSYSINKDMGYIEVPYDANGQDRYTKLYEAGKMRLVPIAYDLSITGRILLNFNETTRLRGSSSTESKSLQNIWGEITDKETQEGIIQIYNSVTGKQLIDNLKSAQTNIQIINKYKNFWSSGIDSYLNNKSDDTRTNADILKIELK